MLEIIKYGSSKYGVWVVGRLQYQEFEILDIFSTNIKEEEFFKDKTSIKPKKVKILKNKNKQVIFSLEF